MSNKENRPETLKIRGWRIGWIP